MGTRTGLVVDGILIPWMIVHYGWRSMFMIIGFSALIWLVPWLGLMPNHLRDHRTPPAPRTRTRPSMDLSLSALLRGLYGLPSFLRSLCTRYRDLLGICLGFFCFDYYWYLLVTWLPDYLVTVRQFTILKAGFFAALPYFVFGVSEPIGGWIADRLVRFGWDETRTRKGIVTIAFATGLMLIPATRITDAGTAITLIIGGSLVGLSTGNLLVMLQACAPRDQVGVWTGVYNFVGNIAGILAPIVTGLLIGWTGSYDPPFALAAVMLLLGSLSFWLIVGQLRPARAEPA
jgi:MFS family permease